MNPLSTTSTVVRVIFSAATIAATAAVLPAAAAPVPDPDPTTVRVFESVGKSTLPLVRRDAYADTARKQVAPYGIYHASGVHVSHAASTADQVYTVDSGNNRVLFFGIYAGSGAPTGVIGQASGDGYASCNRDGNRGFERAPTAATLCLDGHPWANNSAETWTRNNVDTDAQGNLYVVDRFNNRVLMYRSADLVPGRVNIAAAKVWGQSGFTSNAPNRSSSPSAHYDRPPPPTAATLWTGFGNTPDAGFDHVSSRGVSVDAGGKLWVADTFNGRVLRFDTSRSSADLVLGKRKFTEYKFNGAKDGCVEDAPLDAMCTPTLAKLHPNGKLYVVDERPLAFRARILEFTPTPGSGFHSGMAATRSFMVKQPGPFVDWNGGFENGKYRAQVTGLSFDGITPADAAAGALMWVTEHETQRAVLIRADGSIIRVLNAPSATQRGGTWTDAQIAACMPPPEYHARWAVWPGGNLAFSRDGNYLMLADEALHTVHVYWASSWSNVTGCMPLNFWAYFGRGDSHYDITKGPNLSSAAGFHLGGNTAMAYHGNQLIAFDEPVDFLGQTMVKVYAKDRTKTLSDTQFALQFTLNPGILHARPASFLGEAVDGFDRLWLAGLGGELQRWQLPLTPETSAPAGSTNIVWRDGRRVEATFSMAAWDRLTRRMYLLDDSGARIFRLRPFLAGDTTFVVDMVIGQRDATTNSCNYGRGVVAGPKMPGGLCAVGYVRFDREGNLFVVDNRYECQGNRRIAVFGKTLLDNATAMFPSLVPTKLFNHPGMCAPDVVGRPGTPVTVAFDVANRMVVGNDGYYGSIEQRRQRQLFLYDRPADPASGDVPSSAIRLPMGTPADMVFDEQNNLIVRDQTWHRIFKINLDLDGKTWLVAP
jgi:hypothetical protein